MARDLLAQSLFILVNKIIILFFSSEAWFLYSLSNKTGQNKCKFF